MSPRCRATQSRWRTWESLTGTGCPWGVYRWTLRCCCVLSVTTSLSTSQRRSCRCVAMMSVPRRGRTWTGPPRRCRYHCAPSRPEQRTRARAETYETSVSLGKPWTTMPRCCMATASMPWQRTRALDACTPRERAAATAPALSGTKAVTRRSMAMAAVNSRRWVGRVSICGVWGFGGRGGAGGEGTVGAGGKRCAAFGPPA